MLEQQRLQQTGLPSPAGSGNSVGGQSHDSHVTITPSPQPSSTVTPVSVEPLSTTTLKVNKTCISLLIKFPVKS